MGDSYQKTKCHTEVGVVKKIMFHVTMLPIDSLYNGDKKL